jgi:hypothetical protein
MTRTLFSLAAAFAASALCLAPAMSADVAAIATSYAVA